MRNWTEYAPNLSSLINVFLLASLLIIATSLIPAVYNIWGFFVFIGGWIFYFTFLLFGLLMAILPDFVQFIIMGILNLITSFIGLIVNHLVALVAPLLLLAPIPILAFAHHYLYFFLDKYYPGLDSTERGRITGYFPKIASWWYGLYGLLVIIMGMLISDAVISIFPWLSQNSLNLSFLQTSELEAFAANQISFWLRIAVAIFVRPIYAPFIRLIIWVITAAYLYQFEFKVRQHFINSALNSRESD